MRETREVPADPTTHRRTPRWGSSGRRPPSRRGPGPHSEGCGALGTVLGLVHTDQLALQANVADAVLLGDRLGQRVEEQLE